MVSLREKSENEKRRGEVLEVINKIYVNERTNEM